MCRPLGESHEEACPGGHIGPPLRDGGAFRTNGYWRGTMPFLAGRGGARPLQVYRGAQQRADVASAPTGRKGSCRNHPGQRRRVERLRQQSRGMGGNCGRDHPQRGQQPRTIPQSRLRRASSLYTREPLGTGDADCRNQRPKFRHEIWLAVATPQARRPVGPPRNDKGFLSFRGAERRGNPSFLRWTGVRAAEVVGPYGRSTEVPATGRCRRKQRPAAGQRGH